MTGRYLVLAMLTAAPCAAQPSEPGRKLVAQVAATASRDAGPAVCQVERLDEAGQPVRGTRESFPLREGVVLTQGLQFIVAELSAPEGYVVLVYPPTRLPALRSDLQARLAFSASADFVEMDVMPVGGWRLPPHRLTCSR